MTISSRLLRSTALVLALVAGPALAAESVPQAFTATYQVLKDGDPLGEATLTLKAAGNGEYEYSNVSKGTAGLAAMLGANVSEVSRFRWSGNVPEALSYDYTMSALKTKTRRLQVDWNSKQVNVDDNGKSFKYDAAVGMVERNTLPLALGVALRAGEQQVSIPVAVKQEVQSQQFKVSGKEQVTVPAGSFDAVRVDRVDADRGFNAWYVPAKFPVPVKLAQKDGGNLTMELKSFSGK
ncbi:hypothetical protein FHW69_000253 [Luteibacter sp. Sphag1AF]|uniref:DUF3108 domain-containing protein n=1 Tax=Luteibacter sp. Sphag1AF TaxID=2587031 RepID=UPI00161B8706|nr:DUF3108 domain-containing protein [Luteibacter sp. Sphag1AF]MBB3225663.1 hypothetical protein [Luteibacter sp. Sphag1AF]